MAGNIKGITIEFRGDTTKLDKALRQVNNETRAIDKELKNVDKALKFNPTSVELWRQKQQLLTQKISETKDKLDLLKKQQQAMDDAGVDKQSLEYQKLQREIIETESKLKTFEGQLKQIGNVKLQAVGEQFKQWGGSIEQAGQKMQGLSLAAAGVVTSLGAISYKAGQNADDLNTLSKVYGIGTQDLQKYKTAANLVDVSVETIAKSHVKLEKSMASAASGTGANAEAFEKLGVSVVDANGDLRSGDEVWQDTIKALGKVENETERDALAMQLMGKSAAELNPLIEDGGETYENLAKTMEEYGLEFVDQETLDKANQFNDQLDTMKAIGSVALQTVGSQLAAVLVPALEKAVEWIGQLANWLGNLNPKVLAVIGAVAAFVAAIAPALIVIGKMATGVGAILKVVAVLGPAIAGIGTTLLPIIAIIAAVIAIGVLLYKNWDTIKAKAIEFKDAVVAKFTEFKAKVTSIFTGIKDAISNAWNLAKAFVFSIIKNIVLKVTSSFNSLKSTVSSIWNNIKTAITAPITAAKEKVKAIIDKIKSLFPFKVGKIISGLKLPHFKLTGEFSLKNKTVPKLSVDWYKTGGIFDGPQVIGVGEAGPEAVVPLDKLWQKLDAIADSSTSGIVININGANKDPREIAAEVKRMLIQETKRERLAWQ